MKEIKLTQDKVALVDDDDFEYLNQWKWYAQRCKKTYYAARRDYSKINKKRKIYYMHRMIMKTPYNLQVDHINHEGLNNQKGNLRNCTVNQNGANRSPCGKSKYMGILHGGKTYVSSAIKVNGEKLCLGPCKTEIQAAKRYDAAAIFFHGEFANLNFK